MALEVSCCTCACISSCLVQGKRLPWLLGTLPLTTPATEGLEEEEYSPESLRLVEV